MITGTVDSSLRAIIRVRLLDSNGRAHETDAEVDTGYSHYLTLPPSIIGAIGLPVIAQNHVYLADGSVQVIDTYGATAIWDGQPRPIEVDQTDGHPLVGMQMLFGYQLRIDVVDGGTVEIEQRP
jgi:clan AA aspartic protease